MNFWDWLERFMETKDDTPPENADVVNVVIGIGIDVCKNGQEASPQSKAVALKTLKLFQQGKAQNILLTGGYSANGITEAKAMEKVIVNEVPELNPFLEIKSYRTFMNADNTLQILKKNGWKSAIIVAQQWHARRVRATFRKRWVGNEIQFAVVKARSKYGGGSQRRLNHFLLFLIWDTIAFIISRYKGYC